jgi:hypothetical protein
VERNPCTLGATRWLVLVAVALTVALFSLRVTPSSGDEVAWLVGDGELVRHRDRWLVNDDGSLHAVRETSRYRLRERYEQVLDRLTRLRRPPWEVVTSEEVMSEALGPVYLDRNLFTEDVQTRGLKATTRLPMGWRIQFKDGGSGFLWDRRLPREVRCAGALLERQAGSVLQRVAEREVVEVQIVAAEPVGRWGYAPSSDYATVVVRRIRPPTIAEWLGREMERWWERMFQP